MLQSYEAIYDHGKVKWLGDEPADETTRIIVTILPEKTVTPFPGVSHHPSSRIAGKGKILGDIVSPVALEGDWNCLR